METIETPENNPQSNKRKEHIIIGVLAALLIGSLIFNFYQHQSNKAEKELLEVDLADTEQARIVLQNQLTSLTEEFEASRMDLEAKDSLLSQRDAEIFDKQKEIQNILNKSELSDS